MREAKNAVFIDPSLNAQNVVFDGLVVNDRREMIKPIPSFTMRIDDNHPVSD